MLTISVIIKGRNAMRAKFFLIFNLILFSLTHGQTLEDMEIHPIKITEDVVVFKAGENPNGPNVTVVAADKGMIVIDTHLSYRITKKIRKKIEDVTGRNDFAYVINTHHHFDHSNGNQVFPEAVVIGHENSPAEMKKYYEGKKSFIESRKQFNTRLENRLKNLDPDSDEAKQWRAIILYNNLMIEDLNSGFILSSPVITFRDRMALDCGNKSLELYYLGRAHTNTDIFIFIPEEGVLFIGDTFIAGNLALPIYAGNPEVTKWIEVLDSVLNEKNEIKHVVGGHRIIPVADLKELHKYVKIMWNEIQSAGDKGLSLDAVKENLDLDKKFTWMNRIDISTDQNKNMHKTNIEKLFEIREGK